MKNKIKSILYYSFFAIFTLLVLVSAVFTATGTESLLLSILVLIFLVVFLVVATVKRIKLHHNKK